MKNVVVYTGHGCPYCDRAKALLKKKNVAFTEYNVHDDAEKREEMFAKTNGARTIPQIFIGEELIGGCDNLYALESQGKLDEKLAG